MHYNTTVRSLWRPVLDRVTPYEAGPPLEALAAELGVELVRLSANESPLGPSPRVVEAVRREAARVHLYPDGGCRALRAGPGPLPLPSARSNRRSSMSTSPCTSRMPASLIWQARAFSPASGSVSVS